MAIEPATILIVEEPDIVNPLTQVLEADGYRVMVATSRPGHARALVESTPSLSMIVLDLTLSGVELIRHACRTRPDLRVLFLTDGLDSTPFRQWDAVLLKPFKMATFTSIVRGTLEEPFPPIARDWGLGPERRRMVAH